MDFTGLENQIDGLQRMGGAESFVEPLVTVPVLGSLSVRHSHRGGWLGRQSRGRSAFRRHPMAMLPSCGRLRRKHACPEVDRGVRSRPCTRQGGRRRLAAPLRRQPNQIGRDYRDFFERQNKIGSVHECSWSKKAEGSRSRPRIRLQLFPLTSSLRLPTAGKV
jgi:hypothetical protein